MTEAIAEAIARQYLSLARQKEEQEEERKRRELIGELREYRRRLELADEEARRFDEILSVGSTEELRGLRDMYRPIIERQIEELERGRHRLRESAREIQWLESEFETLPPEKRENEAREAWALYWQARAAQNQREKLHWLKEARKRLPKELRSDRF